MTSAIPYWLLFILGVVSVGYSWFVAFRSDEGTRIPRNMMVAVSAVMLIVALGVILFYSTLGGNALWWVTGKDIGFWDKLLRIIPLLVFLAAQAAAPFAYKMYMECYFRDSELSVKSQFISLVVIVPVALIISMFIGSESRDLVFNIIAWTGLIGSAVYAATKNIGSVGVKAGIIYTVTSFVLCAATLVTLLYFVIAFISLILEMLPVIATIIAISIIFSKSYGNTVMRRDDDGNYIAHDGSRHASRSARDMRDSQIHSRQNNS